MPEIATTDPHNARHRVEPWQVPACTSKVWDVEAVTGTKETDEADRSTVEFACEALGDNLGTRFILDPERPDKRVRDREAIDFTARDPAGYMLGIEHTMIEPYGGQILDVNKAEERLGEARRLLEGRLPDDSVFDITFASGSVARMKTNQAIAIANWVQEVAPELNMGRPGRTGHSVTSPKGLFAIAITIHRWPRQFPGPQVRYRIGIDMDRSEERARSRTEKALTDKLPKLEASRVDLGARWTLLCLDTEDWQTTKPWKLGEIMRGTAGEAQLPDHVALVMRAPDGSVAFVWLLRISGDWLGSPSFYSREV
jgi:hypothetical protein